jgi:hypothetical protein
MPIAPLPGLGRSVRGWVTLLVATAVSLGVGVFPAVASTSGGADNVVIATATSNGSYMSNSQLQVSSVGSPTVTSDNIARAESDNCTGCRAAAAAIQAVFVTRDASTVTPGNSVNSNCTGCDSFAFAYQYVLSTSGSVYLSAAAQQQIAQLRRQIADTVASGLPDDQIDARLQSLAGQFKAIIDQDLQQAGVSAQGAVDERADAAPGGG